MSDENSKESHDTMPPSTHDEKALAFAAQIGEYDRRRAARGQTSSGVLRILALASREIGG